MSEYCEHCRFYDDQGTGEGYCRRYPPTVLVAARHPGGRGDFVDFDSRFPVVGAEDWCGEFKAKEKPC